MARRMAVMTLLIVMFNSWAQTSLLPYDSFGQTEEYTAWPRDNDTILSEEFPWASCDNVTGENCPGVMDIIRHICIHPGEDKDCRKDIEMGNVSNKHVVLQLLPGVHHIRLTNTADRHESAESFILFKYWLCNFNALTIQGTRGLETEVMALGDGLNHGSGAWESVWMGKCALTIIGSTQQPSWTTFAFFGGGTLTFKDLTFRSIPEPWPFALPRASISTLNVPRVQVIRCRFNVESTEGAVSLIYTEGFSRFTAEILACKFNLNFSSRGKDENILIIRQNLPPIVIESLTDLLSGLVRQTSATNNSWGNVTILNCRFWSNYTVLGGSYGFIRYVGNLLMNNLLSHNSLFPAHQSQTNIFRQTFRQIYFWPHQLQKRMPKTVTFAA